MGPPGGYDADNKPSAGGATVSAFGGEFDTSFTAILDSGYPDGTG